MTVPDGGPLCMALPMGSLQQMRRMKQQKQTEQAKHWHKGIQESQDKAPDRQAVWGQCKRGSKHIQKNPIWLHALAIRAAAAPAAVPEQSPPASQLWGATPESPYWSLEWAETHFLWAQATWRKEQKGLRQVVVKWWEGGCGVRVRQCGGRGVRVEGQRDKKEGEVNEKKKTNKKIIEDISQAEAGLLRHTMLIEE